MFESRAHVLSDNGEEDSTPPSIRQEKSRVRPGTYATPSVVPAQACLEFSSPKALESVEFSIVFVPKTTTENNFVF